MVTGVVTRCIMADSCLQSLVMYGNTFEHNWNGSCQDEKCINIHIVNEHTYFSIFIMIPLLLMLMTVGHIQNICYLSMMNYANLKVNRFTF